MTERIVLSIVSLAMFFLSRRQHGRFSKIITAGLTVGVLLTWVSHPDIITIGFAIYTICSLLAAFYGVTKGHLSDLMRIIISWTGIIIFTHNVSAILQYPYATEMKWLMTIPIAGYFVILILTRFKFTPETGFMTILTVDCLLHFLKMWL